MKHLCLHGIIQKPVTLAKGGAPRDFLCCKLVWSNLVLYAQLLFAYHNGADILML